MLYRMKLFILNLYFYAFFFLVSAIVIPALTLAVTIAGLFMPRRWTMKRFRRAISWYGILITSILYPFIKLRYEDRGKNGAKEPYIFVCNHRAASDAFLMCVLPHECVQIVNVWPFRIPVLGLYARFSGYLNIKMMPHEQFMEQATKLLSDGVSIIFFPKDTFGEQDHGKFSWRGVSSGPGVEGGRGPALHHRNENIRPGVAASASGYDTGAQNAGHHLGRI
jgi:1-acyl-sn-glycerol-3-phosphate acyltransferase